MVLIHEEGFRMKIEDEGKSHFILRLLAMIDGLIGVMMAWNPGAVQEWLYPAMTLSGGLLGISQIGLLRLGRATVSYCGGARALTWMWLGALPMHIWSMIALNYLGHHVMWWHGGHSFICMLLVLYGWRSNDKISTSL